MRAVLLRPPRRLDAAGFGQAAPPLSSCHKHDDHYHHHNTNQGPSDEGKRAVQSGRVDTPAYGEVLLDPEPDQKLVGVSCVCVGGAEGERGREGQSAEMAMLDMCGVQHGDERQQAVAPIAWRLHTVPM